MYIVRYSDRRKYGVASRKPGAWVVAPAEAEVIVVVRGDEVGSRIGVGEVVAAVGVVVVVVADVASASRLHAQTARRRNRAYAAAVL